MDDSTLLAWLGEGKVIREKEARTFSDMNTFRRYFVCEVVHSLSLSAHRDRSGQGRGILLGFGADL